MRRIKLASFGDLENNMRFHLDKTSIRSKERKKTKKTNKQGNRSITWRLKIFEHVELIE